MASTINILLPEPLSSSLEEHLLHALKQEGNALDLSDDDWEHADIVGLMESHAAKAA